MTVNHDRDARAEQLVEAQRVIDANADRTVQALADDIPDTKLAAILGALAVLRAEAAADVFVAPAAQTGAVGALPIRAVTEIDARVIATTLRAYITLVDALHGALGTTALVADIRDRLERVLLELDA